MKSILQMPWISKNIEIIDSSDPSLIGIKGIILDETSRTLAIKSQNRRLIVPKDVVKMKIASFSRQMFIVGPVYGQASQRCQDDLYETKLHY